MNQRLHINRAVTIVTLLTAVYLSLAAAIAREPWRSQYDSISEYSDAPYKIGEVYRVSINDLRPTQFTVGMAEVRDRRTKLSEMTKSELRAYLKEKPGSVVIGPGEEFWLVDGHHLARALSVDGDAEMLVRVVANWSDLSKREFFERMRKKNWMWLFDEQGRGPRDPRGLPATIQKLHDDPYRSLAWKVKKAGGFSKSDAPFAEFKWAEFFRQQIPIEELRRGGTSLMKKALALASSAKARQLPGYIRSKICAVYLSPVGPAN